MYIYQKTCEEATDTFETVGSVQWQIGQKDKTHQKNYIKTIQEDWDISQKQTKMTWENG